MDEFQSISDSVTEEALDNAMFDDSQDVTPAANEPAPSDETVVVAPEADEVELETEDGTPVEPLEIVPPDETSQEVVEAPLNWDSAPEQFRETYKTLKQQFEAASTNSLQEKYFEGAEPFLDELSKLSTSQFQQTTQQIVEKGIEQSPDMFADYIASVNPDAIASAMAKVSPERLAAALDLGMPIEQARKIIAQVKQQDLLEYLNDNDDGKTKVEPVVAQSDAPKAMTPEDIEKLVAQRVAEAGKPQAVEALEQQTYAEIMKPVESMLAEAGLAPLATDTAEDKEFKAWASESIIRDTFGYLMDNETNAPQAKKMMEFIQNLDKAGVKHLATTAKIKAEDYAGKRIEMLTNQRAKAKGKGTEPRKQPPKVVPSGAGVAAFGNPGTAPAGRIGDISDSEFESVGL